MKRKFRWIDLALLPFGLCVLFLLLLGKLFGLTYKQISVLLLAIIFAFYGIFHMYAFIKMLRHYHLPFNDAFDLCVVDLQRAARKWHTTYQIVNLLIFVLFYLILIGFNVLICYYLLSL